MTVDRTAACPSEQAMGGGVDGVELPDEGLVELGMKDPGWIWGVGQGVKVNGSLLASRYGSLSGAILYSNKYS